MIDLQNEWAIIHRDIESYARFSLLIKLVSILICTLAIVFSIKTFSSIFIILVLWLQDGIWKTFQQRLENRILLIESNIQNKRDDNPFQLYSEWKNKRLKNILLIKEYCFNSLKPTIAYPYAVLISLLLLI